MAYGLKACSCDPLNGNFLHYCEMIWSQPFKKPFKLKLYWNVVLQLLTSVVKILMYFVSHLNKFNEIRQLLAQSVLKKSRKHCAVISKYFFTVVERCLVQTLHRVLWCYSRYPTKIRSLLMSLLKLELHNCPVTGGVCTRNRNWSYFVRDLKIFNFF